MAADDKHIVEVLDWYQKTSSRTVDLIGDYAGSELFLIELDSLLLFIFTDPLLDFDEGFQLLQAVHATELFLNQLRKRKCHFALVAFQQHFDLCVPSHAAPENDYKYHLAREIIMSHLGSNSNVNLDVFEGSQDPAFHKHMNECGAYFLMVHDGSHAQIEGQVESEEFHGMDRFKRARLRQSIMSCMNTNHTVALINGIEFRDTKVMATVLEANVRRNKVAVAVHRLNSSINNTSASPDLSISDVFAESGLTSVSLSLTILTLKHLNQGRKQDSRLNLSIVIHSWLLQHIPLSSRSVRTVRSTVPSEAYLKAYSKTAKSILESDSWKKLCGIHDSCFDVADFIDGRIFHLVAANTFDIYSQLSKHSHAFTKDLLSLWSLLGAEDSVEQILSAASANGALTLPIAATPSVQEPKDEGLTLLPFSNDIFDAHLECVKIKVENDDSHVEDAGGIFKELTHWHNTNLLSQLTSKKKPQTIAEQRAASRAMRRNQFRMRDMSNYAASLTNSSGRVLEPEGVFVQTAADLKAARKDGKSSASRPPPKNGKQPPTKKGSTKSESASTIIARETEKRTEAVNAKIFQAWEAVLRRIEKENKDPQRRYLEVCKYISGLPQSKADLLEVEVLFYNLVQLMQLCSKPPFSATSKPRNFYVAAMIWDCINKVRVLDLDDSCLRNLETTCKTMGFPMVNGKRTATTSRKSAFQFSVPAAIEVKIADVTEFQLNHCGPFFDRTIEAEPDSRVRFKPDKWQRQVLDLIDQRKSAFVVAPTSAGKTFISFYAMKKVLQEDNEGVLVYVAPTKALVNQISAEIQANFNKTYPHAGISIWALHTRDYRINEPTRCQVLVTVPHILQIMLLSPSNATKFSTRVKRIIFDEIHCIGQAEDGLIWEQLLLLAPCPIIALSATVGNPEQFSDWLKTTQMSTGNELAMIKHSTRYNDLRKYVFIPPAQREFTGLSTATSLAPLGIDSPDQFAFIHPVTSLVNKSRGIPEDLNLESRDCLQLWHAMKSASNDKYPLPEELNPSYFSSKTVRKADVIKWEKRLKELLATWMCDSASPFDAVHRQLYDSFLRKVNKTAEDNDEAEGNAIPDSQSELIETILPLLKELNINDALPALIFNYDRSICENICKRVVAQLEAAEEIFKETSSSWKKKLAEHAEYVKKMEKSMKASKKASAAKDKGSVEDGASRADMLADSAQSTGDKGSIAYFRPEDPLDSFTFANKKKASPTEIDDAIKKLQWSSISPKLIKALSRGIGVHHAGMNLAYRQCVEMLFRKGYLRVVIATGTLALGINMPCKTVVFAGDSIYLTALNYRQAAGRAGRRGFDLLGNVVFHGISIDKIFRLISSRLPDLNGHFPVTTSLVLRLFNLLNDSEQSPFAKAAINSLLSQPRLYLGGDDFKEQVLHHLRFSIEYLRRQKLLDYKGAPINFAGCIMHLYYTESSSFAFHALLKSGFFHRLAASLESNTEEQVMLELMVVMTHMFGRRPLRLAELEDGYYEKRIHRSPSIVSLPPLPQDAEQTLQAHNEEVKHIFEAYVRSFAEQHLKDKVENVLPLSKTTVGGTTLSDEIARDILHSQAPNKVRSAFTSLSGHDDTFSSIHELCTTARDGVFLEESIIPHVPVYTSDKTDRLNSYLLDFYKHGDLRAIEEANGIRKGDIWFLLNDFSLVVATIVTSLKNYMNLADSDMLEVRGRGDNKEDEIDDLLYERLLENGVAQSNGTEQQPATVKKKKKAVVDSWEDDADAQEDAVRDVTENLASMDTNGNQGKKVETDMREGAGLLKVLKMFERLKITFDDRFKATWA